MGKQAKINSIQKKIAEKTQAAGAPVTRDFPPAIRKQFANLSLSIGRLQGAANQLNSEIKALADQRNTILEQVFNQLGIDLRKQKVSADLDAGTYTITGNVPDGGESMAVQEIEEIEEAPAEAEEASG